MQKLNKSQKNRVIADFLKIYWPVFLSFISGIFTVQTDITMLSWFSEKEYSYYAVGNRFMILDTIFCISLVPVISQILLIEKKQDSISEIISFTIFSSVIISILSIIFIPLLIDLFTSGDTKLIQQYTALRSFFIISSMLSFILSFIHHNQGNGKLVVRVAIGLVLINVVLNYLCIAVLDKGLIGCLLSTILTEFICCFILLKKINTKINIKFNYSFITKIFNKLKFELPRVSILQVQLFLLMSIFTKFDNINIIFYTWFFIPYRFLQLPILACMRSTNILLNKHNNKIKNFEVIFIFTFTSFLFILLDIYFFIENIGVALFKKIDTFFNTIAVIALLSACFFFIRNMYIALLNSLGDYKTPLKIEIVSATTSLLCAYILVYNDFYEKSFIAILFGELVFSSIAFFCIKIKYYQKITISA